MEQDFLRPAATTPIAARPETARGDRQARARRRLLAALATALSLLLVAAGATWLAVNRQQAASTAGRQAQADRLGALALVTPDLDRSLLLAVQAVRTHDDWETRGDLLAVLSRSPQALRQVRGISDQTGSIEHVALTPDGSTLVATEGSGGGRVFTWNAATLAPAGEPTLIGQRAEAITPGPDPFGVFISVAILHHAPGTVYWDARDRPLATYPLPTGVTARPGEAPVHRSAGTARTDQPAAAALRPDHPRHATRLPLRTRRRRVRSSLFPTALADSRPRCSRPRKPGEIVRNLPAVRATSSPARPVPRRWSSRRSCCAGQHRGRAGAPNFRATDRDRVAFSVNGTLLAITSDDRLIGVWDASTPASFGTRCADCAHPYRARLPPTARTLTRQPDQHHRLT